MLRCTDLWLEVPGRVLLHDFTTAFGPGQVWAVLGRNGTGKTTLIHALAGLSAPARGRVELEGESLTDLDARARARCIGVLLQIEEGTYWGTVTEYVRLGRFAHIRGWAGYSRDDEQAANAALDAVGMRDYGLRRYATLSGGERQRVRIAQILAQAPRVLLLDEPLQHLDLAHQAHVLASLGARAREHAESVIMVLHEPLWIGRACTHALVMTGDGTALAGDAETLLTRECLEHAYGLKLREIEYPAGRCFVPDV